MNPIPLDSAALTAAKKALRARVLAARDALTAQARRNLSSAIQERLVSMSAYASAGTVAAYCSFGSELETARFIQDILRSTKILLLPRIERSLRALVFHVVDDPETQLIPGPWGIREPDPARCPVGDLKLVDFMLVPGVAFTSAGARLGYGGGYYDRVLAQLPEHTARIAAAFSLQMVDVLPSGPMDQKVSGVLTESGGYGLAKS